MKKSRTLESLSGYLFALPWFIGLSVFLLYPVCASIYFSFCEYSVLKPPIWVGTENYTDLFHDELFLTAIKNTALYALAVLPFSIFLGIFLAMMLNSKVRGLAFYRTIFFLPSLLPQVSLAVLWLWVFNGSDGVLNEVLGMLHIKGPNWLSDPMWSKPALVLLSLWGVGNAVVIYLAGLQDVPVQLLEAADLDGASSWQKTRHVTLPMLSPVILFNGIMGLIGTLQVFAVPYVMFPGGSPARSTYFYAMYLFDNAFRYNKMGYACAMGWILFLAILVLTLIALKISEKHVYYGGDAK